MNMRNLLSLSILAFSMAGTAYAQQAPAAPAPKEVALTPEQSVTVLKLQREVQSAQINYQATQVQLQQAQAAVQATNKAMLDEEERIRKELKLPDNATFDQMKLVFTVPAPVPVPTPAKK